jgi:hypothetical protein
LENLRSLGGLDALTAHRANFSHLWLPRTKGGAKHVQLVPLLHPRRWNNVPYVLAVNFPTKDPMLVSIVLSELTHLQSKVHTFNARYVPAGKQHHLQVNAHAMIALPDNIRTVWAALNVRSVLLEHMRLQGKAFVSYVLLASTVTVQVKDQKVLAPLVRAANLVLKGPLAAAVVVLEPSLKMEVSSVKYVLQDKFLRQMMLQRVLPVHVDIMHTSEQAHASLAQQGKLEQQLVQNLKVIAFHALLVNIRSVYAPAHHALQVNISSNMGKHTAKPVMQDL